MFCFGSSVVIMCQGLFKNSVLDSNSLFQDSVFYYELSTLWINSE